MKYIRELISSPEVVRGKLPKQIILIKFRPTPAMPLPTMMALVYLPGSIPPSPNTLVWPTALVTPIKNAIIHITANPIVVGKIELKIGAKTSIIAKAI